MDGDVELFSLIPTLLAGYSKVSSGGRSSFCDALNSPVDRYCDIWDGYLRDNYDSVKCLCR